NQNAPAAFTAVAKRGLRFYFWAALLMAAPAAALAWYAPRGLHAGAGLLIPLRWAVAIAVASSLALTPAAIFRSVLETSQRGYRVRAALLLQSLLITALCLLLVGVGWGIVGMAAATACGLALGAALAAGVVPNPARSPLRARSVGRQLAARAGPARQSSQPAHRQHRR